ncbi:hypothetical protein RchiOBHm_Chr6g0262921 [Rosa chinensis]|uniref:Uncharacterized protein n=1 Tax=Rosa chinensis TaxID=74649 RepID=A0A2P6PNS6_ROSCH|nr:hypothetical protein RchiOBHm_Chr6g0262921 [Rosa chinensis]
MPTYEYHASYNGVKAIANLLSCGAKWISALHTFESSLISILESP